MPTKTTMPFKTPDYVMKAFLALQSYEPEYNASNIQCLMDTDIEIYSIIFNHNSNYYQATTYFNTNYSIKPDVTITKLLTLTGLSTIK